MVTRRDAVRPSLRRRVRKPRFAGLHAASQRSVAGRQHPAPPSVASMSSPARPPPRLRPWIPTREPHGARPARRKADQGL